VSDLALRRQVAEARGFRGIVQRGVHLWGGWPGETHHQKAKVPCYDCDPNSACGLRDVYVEVKPCEGMRHAEAKAQKEAFAKEAKP
jgi:hypothetical protein